jgi:hypothetical protein
MTTRVTWCVLGVLSALLLVPSVGAQAPPSPLLPTNPAVDLVFTPVAPCRIIDTRSAGGPIGANTTRNFAVAGTTGFGAQGGNATGCGIPEGAAAAVINYVAVGPAGPGDLRVTAAGTPIPTASVLNYSAVAGLNIANGVATPLGTGAAPHITVQADVSATDLVADVLGYYNQTSCQTGTVKVLGLCWETTPRAFASVFAASDTCRQAGGRLANTLELRSLRSSLSGPLTIGPPDAGEWVDAMWQSPAPPPAGDFSLIVFDNGGILMVGADDLHPYRCVFQPLP